MAELRIPLDPCNPGQFYACCGLIELFELSGTQTLSKFVVNWHSPRQATFILESSSSPDLLGVFNLLRNPDIYEYVSRQKMRDRNRKQQSDKEGEQTDDGDKAPALRLHVKGRIFEIDWWLDVFRQKVSPLKLWPGRATTQTVMTTLIRALPARISQYDLFDTSGAYVKGRFGIDPRSSWEALDQGYSPHAQNENVLTYVVVELLGAVGLQGFRPRIVSRGVYGYSAWACPIPPQVARTVCARAWDGFPAAEFVFRLEQRSSRSKRLGDATLTRVC